MGSQSCSASSSAATEDLAPPSTSPSSPPPFYDLSSNECDGDEYLPKGTNYQSSSSDEDSGSDSELDFDSRQESSLDLDDLLSIFEAKVGEQSNPEMPLFTWQRENNKPQVFGFSGCFGVNVDDLHQTSTPFEIYSHFVTPKLMDHLVRETNRYVTFISLSPACITFHIHIVTVYIPRIRSIVYNLAFLSSSGITTRIQHRPHPQGNGTTLQERSCMPILGSGS